MSEVSVHIQYLIDCMKSEFNMKLGPLKMMDPDYRFDYNRRKPRWHMMNCLPGGVGYLIFFDVHSNCVELSSIYHSISIFYRDFVQHSVVIEKLAWFVDTRNGINSPWVNQWES